jgi:hypothetical protein
MQFDEAQKVVNPYASVIGGQQGHAFLKLTPTSK